jgi:hypothetical protein
MNVELKQVGAKYRLRITETGGYLRQMGPRKLSKDRAEYRAALLNGEEPYDYTNDPTSPEVEESTQAAINAYVEKQQGYIATAQGKIDTDNVTIVEQNAIIEQQQAIIDNPDSTEEEKAVAQAAIVDAQTKITKAEKDITTQEGKIAGYQANIDSAATKVTEIVINEVPEVLTLDNSGYKVNIKADFSANETTTVEANEKIEKDVTIENTGEPANVIIDLGNSNKAILRGEWNEVTVKSISDNSMTIATGTHMKKLIVKMGHVWVNNAFIEDAVDEVVVEGGRIDANPEVEVTTAGKMTGSPAVYKINTNISARNIAMSAIGSGHYIYENNAKVSTTGTSTSSGFMVRGGSKMLVELKGEGEWRSATNPTIWNSHFDALIKIFDGKYFNDGNHSECIYAEKGFIEIYGGEFHNVFSEEKNFLINCLDANYLAGTAGIKVFGGKFYGFDPAHNDTNPGGETNYVAEGYESVYHEDGDYYEVIPINEGE